MSDLLSDNDGVMNAVMLALCDPGSVTPRAPKESPESWQRRAVIEHAAPLIAAAERERIRQVVLAASKSPTWRAITNGGDALRQFFIALAIGGGS